MDQKQDLNVAHHSKLFVAMPNTPLCERFSGAILINSIPKVVVYKTQFLLQVESQSNSRYIWKQDIMTDVIPPALPEMWEDMLETQLNDLIKQVPEVQQVKVSNHEGWQEPVAKVNTEVVVEVITDVFPSKVAIVVIGVVTFCQVLVQFWVKEPKKISSISRPMIEHAYNKAKVYKR